MKKIFGMFLVLLMLGVAGIATAGDTNENSVGNMVFSCLSAGINVSPCAAMPTNTHRVGTAVVVKDHGNISEYTLNFMSAGAMVFLPDIGYSKGSSVGSPSSGKLESVSMAYISDIQFNMLC